MIHKAGYKTQFSQLYSADDPTLETDVQFAVTAALIGHYEAHDSDNEPAPDADVKARWYSLRHRFVVMRGQTAVPMAPITGKVEGERAEMVVLERVKR
jgi:hydroxyquinol 1,2-dioxygenase